MKICKNCGSQNPDNIFNCQNCGAPFEMQQPYVQQPQPPYQAQPQYRPQQQKGISKNTMIIIVVAIVAVAAVVIAAMFITKGSGKEAVSDSTATVATTAATTQQPALPSTSAPDTTRAQNNDKNATLRKARPTTTAPKNYNYTYYDPEYYWLDTREVTNDFLSTMSKDEIDYLRNAPYAWHGYIFKKDKYWDYYCNVSWYNPVESSMSVAESEFNSTERKNIDKIVKYQKAHGQR